MSGIWVIIPLKPLALAKSRLAKHLTPEQRQRLAESLFRHVLSVARNAPQIAGTLVISRDTKALAIAREYGAKTVQEGGVPDLNHALFTATQIVSSWKGKGVLILPADLPLISREDLTEMVMMGREPYSVVVATDRNEDGTNAMLVKPPGLFEYGYGVGSFQRHMTRAQHAGACVHVYRSERLALDIDMPHDLETYQSLSEHIELIG
jgi:2-phospho-L-lactate/phosphoenolpyruvate guanylyltransferase